jgi:ATP-dependent DNA helicase RecG
MMLFHFEETPAPRTTPDDLDTERFATYYERVYGTPFAQAEMPLLSMLKNMRFVVPDMTDTLRLSLAGLLLFGKKPEDYMLFSGISAVRWQGVIAGETIIDRQEIYGTLPEIITTTEKFLLRNTRLQTTIKEFRQEDREEYPRAALREAIVNAVAHRDYSISGSQIRVFLFDDRLEVYSPGGLPNGVTLDNVRTHFSRARNDIIVRVLLNLGYVNSLGSGIPRMIRLMKQHVGREPEFEVGMHQFMVRLWGQ